MELNRKQIQRILLIVTVSIIIFFAVQKLDVVLAVAGQVVNVIMPFIIGLCVAFILNIPMRFFEKLLGKCKPKKAARLWAKLRRPLSLVISILLIVCLVVVLMVLVVPEIRKTILIIMERLPGQIEWLVASVTAWLDKMQLDQTFLQSLSIDWNQLGGQAFKIFTDGGTSLLNSTISFTSSFIGNLVNLVLGFVFAFYILMGKERLGVQLRKIAYALLPEKGADSIFYITRMSNGIFSKFVVGQCTEAVILGLLCYIGMLLLRLPYAIMISSLVTVTALIPVFGAFIGTAVGAVLIFFQSPLQALWFILFIIVLQQIEGNIIYPKVVGESVGLPGIWVLCAVTIGGSLFGAMGMLISVPICALAYCLIREGVNGLLKKKKVPAKRYE